MFKTIALCFLQITLSMLLVNVGLGAQSDPPTRPTTVLPFTTVPNWGTPIVEVKLNDKVTAKFLVDTGVNSSILSEEMASKLGLSPQPATKNGRPYTLGSKQGRMVTLSQMQLGGFTISQPIPLIVSETNQLSSFPQPIDGIIGINILSIFMVEFDFPRHQITLWNSADLSDAAIKGSGFSGAMALPITQRENGTYTVPGVFSSSSSQISTRLLLDTGAAETSVSASIARSLDLKPGAEQSNGSFWGQINYTQTEVSALQIGDLKLRNLPVDYAANGDVRFPCGLGMDILSHYRMLLDFSSKKMYLQSNLPAK